MPNPPVRMPHPDQPAVILQVRAADRIKRRVLILIEAEVQRPAGLLRVDVSKQRRRIREIEGLRVLKEMPQGSLVCTANLLSHLAVVENSLPPVEHRLRSLQRRARAVRRDGRGRVIAVLQRQEIEVEVGEMLGEGSAAGTVVGMPGKKRWVVGQV